MSAVARPVAFTASTSRAKSEETVLIMALGVLCQFLRAARRHYADADSNGDGANVYRLGGLFQQKRRITNRRWSVDMADSWGISV